MTRPYRFGLLVGRFQMPHIGHMEMIEKALTVCARVGLLIGSAQESGTSKNPFSFETRAELLRLLFSQGVDIAPLPDIGVGNNATWGAYVLETARKQFGETPDLMISGKEGRRLSWFDFEAAKGIAELYIPKTVDISASEMRFFLIADDRAKWERYTDERLWGQYDRLRALALLSRDNCRTDSI